MRNVVILLSCAGALWFSLSGAQSPLSEDTPLPLTSRPGTRLLLSLGGPLAVEPVALMAGRARVELTRELRGRFTFVDGVASVYEDVRGRMLERPTIACVLNVDGDFGRDFVLEDTYLVEDVLMTPRRGERLSRVDYTLVLAARDFAWERPALRQVTLEISYTPGALPVVTPRTLRACLGDGVRLLEVPAAKALGAIPYRMLVR